MADVSHLLDSLKCLGLSKRNTADKKFITTPAGLFLK